MSLQKFCRKPVVKISADVNIVDACRILEEKNVGCLIVETDEKLCGVITDRDIALKVTGAQRDPQKTTVNDIMTTDPIRIFGGQRPASSDLAYARLPCAAGSDRE